jgi:glycogen(starch) synthase
MRMLFVSNLYPPHHLGGYELLCHEVATHLTARGHEVAILTSDFGVKGPTPEPGVYRQLKLASDIYYYRPQQVLRYWADGRANRQAIRKALAETAPDVVVIWGMWNLSPLVAAWVERLAGHRVVYYLASQWPAEPTPHEAYWDGTANRLPGRLFKRLLRRPVRLALHREWRPYALRFEHVIACSRFVRDGLVQAGVPVADARIIYLGIDPVPYQEAAAQREKAPPTQGLRVAYVGALVPHKGPHTAVEALGLLAGDGASPAVSLTILGSGHPEYEERLHAMVRRWKLEDKVTFQRPIPRAQLPGFLARFDALVMPSVWEEPLARISQEAMASGLVLVATPTGGTPEILIDGENGLAFAPEDAHALAGHLRRLATDADLRRRLACEGRRTVLERFTLSRMIGELEAYLADVAAKGRLGAVSHEAPDAGPYR